MKLIAGKKQRDSAARSEQAQLGAVQKSPFCLGLCQVAWSQNHGPQNGTVFLVRSCKFPFRTALTRVDSQGRRGHLDMLS